MIHTHDPLFIWLSQYAYQPSIVYLATFLVMIAIPLEITGSDLLDAAGPIGRPALGIAQNAHRACQAPKSHEPRI